jgi:hypothetical protein
MSGTFLPEFLRPNTASYFSEEFAAVAFERQQDVLFLSKIGLLRSVGRTGAVEFWAADVVLEESQSLKQMLTLAKHVLFLFETGQFCIVMRDVGGGSLTLRFSERFTVEHLKGVLIGQGCDPEAYTLTHLGRDLRINDADRHATTLRGLGVTVASMLVLARRGALHRI